MKMKSLLVLMMALAVFAASAEGTLTFLPDSEMSEYNGYSTFDQNGVSGRLEFAVYDTTLQDLAELDGMSGYNGEQYVYAYQIFTTSVEAITSLALSGYGAGTFTEADMDTSQTLGGEESYGYDAESWGLFDDEAVWFFEGGVLVAYKTSYFLMVFSDYAPVMGSYEVNSSGSDPYVPGGEEATPTPEPATLGLLAVGALLSLRRKKTGIR